MHHVGGMVSVTQLLSKQLWRAPARRRGAAAVLVNTLADDVLLWHLDEDGWD